jgi:nucleoside-diphosphate-sugar epimerase
MSSAPATRALGSIEQRVNARSGAQVLLTGATGFLGKVVLHDLLARRTELDIECVHLLIRPQQRGADERFEQEIAGSPCLQALPEGWRHFVRVVPGDLVETGGLLAAKDELSGRLTHIIHCAASVDFNLPLGEALASNTTSALRMLELAQGCSRLVSMVSVSTAYVTPWRSQQGRIEEVLAPLPRPATELYDAILAGEVAEDELLTETRHPNTYTLTKCLSEHLLGERRRGVPLTIVRPSIISTSLERPFPGRIDSPAAFALFIIAVGSGRLRAVVGDPSTRLDVIPCDEVSERVLDAAFSPPPTQLCIRHAVAGHSRGLKLATCRQIIESWFQHNPVSRNEKAVQVHYLGPPGRRFLAQHRRHHLSRRDARLVAPKIETMNELFSYFTRNSFDFASSRPFERESFSPERYIEIVARGVAVHLMDADLGEVSIGGREHPRPPRRFSLRSPVPGISSRAARQAEAHLAEHFDAVSFDRLSFESALATLGEVQSLGLVAAVPDTDAEVLLTHLAASQPQLWPGRIRIAKTTREPRLPVAIERRGSRVHLRCESERAPKKLRLAQGVPAPAPYLVTGASGFLGHHLLEALAREVPGRQRIALVRDETAWREAPHTGDLGPLQLAVGSVTDAAHWSDGLPRLGGIFHLAAIVRHSRQGSEEMLRTNVEGCLAMVRLAAQHACRLVLLSTSGTVGCFRDDGIRADEEAEFCNTTIARWPYYVSKRRAEEACRALADELGVELTIIRPPVLLGPGDHRFRSTHNVMRALQGRLPFVVRGGMHFADVRDCAQALVRAMTCDDPRPIYHLPGTVCSIQEFFGMIEALSGVPGPRFVVPRVPARAAASLCARLGVNWVPDPVVVEMASHYWGTTSLYARDELDYHSRPGKETLSDTIAWLREHPGTP